MDDIYSTSLRYTYQGTTYKENTIYKILKIRQQKKIIVTLHYMLIVNILLIIKYLPQSIMMFVKMSSDRGH